MKDTANDMTPREAAGRIDAAIQTRTGIDRREFLKVAAATGLLASALPVWSAESQSGMPYRRLGRTGEKVSLLIAS